MAQQLYIGLMSGTSMDGVDGVLIDLAPDAGLRILQHAHAPYEATLRAELLALNLAGHDELHRAALAGNAVARAYAGVVSALLQRGGRAAHQIRAVGAHGQTVRHQPLSFDGVGYTSQLLNAALLAEHTGIDVVSDFRTRDLAAGGQGAPLVPAFHQAAFGNPERDIAVLNIGGIANITLLPAHGQVTGHDCGPGNVLLDLWSARHTGQPYDADGQWARGGACSEPLLAALMQDGYVRRTPPKSTGRDHYNAQWLDNMLADNSLSARDVQCTLTHFTAQAAGDALRRTLPSTMDLLVCGGGARNGFLMHCLRAALPRVRVVPIDAVSALDPMHVESAAFAWLAKAFIERHPGNLPAVTGAAGLRVLGALHPA